MATHPVKIPRCYGLLLDMSLEDCQQCLLNESCSSAMKRGPLKQSDITLNNPAKNEPTSKKLLALAVVRKYGLPAVIHSRKWGELELTEQTLDDFYNIDCFLTSIPALQILLRAKLTPSEDTDGDVTDS